MSGYKYEKETVGLMKEGDYEVVVERIEKKILPSGREKLSIMYRVRSDVEQSYKNKCVFEDIWQEKDNPQFFNRRRINQLLGTQEIVDGTTFGSIDDVIDYIGGTYLIIHVGVVFNDYTGEDVNTVSYYKSSKNKPQALAQPTPTPTPTTGGIIDDDDLLPF